jgi:uncharacterized protein
MTHLEKLAAAAAAGLIAATPALAQDREGWPSDITIGTASQGGTYFVYGNGLASFIGESLGVSASGEVTGGPVQNVTLVEFEEHDIGLVTMGPVREAWEGESELSPGHEHQSVRALFPMYQTPFQVIVMAASGIESVSDLDGRRVSVGPAGGTPGTYWPRFFEALDLNVNVSYAGASDAGGQLQDGLIDAFAFAAGVPIATFSELAVSANVHMFGFTDEERERILEVEPALSEFLIEAGTYPGHDYDQPTVAMWNFAVAHENMPESLAYEITKLVLENNDRMVQIHATAEETLAENWEHNTIIPYHPGAVRYYEEIGIDIPEELRG